MDIFKKYEKEILNKNKDLNQSEINNLYNNLNYDVDIS